MGIFGGTGASGDAGNGKTIIARGCTIRGELTGSDAVHVDGTFEGSIIDVSMVSIGLNGEVRGTIRARRVVISGRFEGEIRTGTLDLMQKAMVKGEVCCEQLSVERGGVLDGRCCQEAYEASCGDAVALPAPLA